MCTTDDEVCRLRNMFCKIKYIVFKIKILTVLLLCRSFGNLEITFWIKRKFFCHVIILVLKWKIIYIYITFYEDFQKSGRFFKSMKTSRSSNSSRVFFLWIFTRGLLSNVRKSVQKICCFALFVVIKKNWRAWFFETCRHSLTCI